MAASSPGYDSKELLSHDFVVVPSNSASSQPKAALIKDSTTRKLPDNTLHLGK